MFIEGRQTFVTALAIVSLALATACGTEVDPPETSEVTAGGEAGQVDGKVIYGDDNRRELYQEKTAAVAALADSTVAVLDNDSIGPNIAGYREIKGTTYQRQQGLCADEPFAGQIAAAFCSGFLVAPNAIATAGHCIRSAADCSKTSFAFGYSYKTAASNPKRVPAGEVYKCKQIIRREENSSGADFAIIQLDRVVSGHAPLPVRTSGAVKVGDPLVVIGYPSGIPLKIADGASVRDDKPAKFFVANLDTYGGNSGSAVFNTATRVVEGILVRGEQDFVLDPAKNCARSNKCAANACRGEDVTRITETVAFIPGLKKPAAPKPTPKPTATPKK